MLDRIAFGKLFKVSCCFKPSVLNFRQMCDNIWSCMSCGSWFLEANSEAALTVSLCCIEIISILSSLNKLILKTSKKYLTMSITFSRFNN